MIDCNEQNRKSKFDWCTFFYIQFWEEIATMEKSSAVLTQEEEKPVNREV